MKKVLSVLSLVAILGLTTPAFAAPHGGPGGPGGPHGGGGHRINAGAHHRPHMAPSHHHHRGGVRVYTSHHHPRHSHWYGYRPGYWGSPWCDYRLGCYPYHYPGFGVHIPMGGASFAVHF